MYRTSRREKNGIVSFYPLVSNLILLSIRLHIGSFQWHDVCYYDCRRRRRRRKRKMRLEEKEIAQRDRIFKQFGKRRITWRQVMMYCTCHCQLTKLPRRSSLSARTYTSRYHAENKRSWLKWEKIQPIIWFASKHAKRNFFLRERLTSVNFESVGNVCGRI